MNRPRGRFARLFHAGWGALTGRHTDAAPVVERTSRFDVPAPAPATAMTSAELIKEGLRQRQVLGAAAAQPFFERAAVLDPRSHLPFFMLGNVASELGDLDAAVARYAHARDLSPNDHVIRYNLGLNEMWRGDINSALTQLRAACTLAPEYLKAHSSYLMALHNSDLVTPDEIAKATREWGQRFALQHPATAPQFKGEVDDVPAILLVGFISGDFRAHSVAHFFEPIASEHNRSAFKYIFYSTSPHQDSVTSRLRAYADVYRDASSLTDDALIALIRADHIDILVDLAGHTDFNRLAVFARRAAPIQVSYLGYPDSTGLPTMDYRITDALTDSQPLADTWHTERLLRLPDSQWCFRPFGALNAPGPLPANKAGFVTFGSFNNITKVSNTVLQCWAQIILRSPNSRLRLTRIRSPQRAAEMVVLLGRWGVAAERIDCVPYDSDVPYGLQFTGADIALDPYPYNGVTTTCESLYFGLPVISLYGQNGVSRSGLSLLASLGLRELVAAAPEEYIEIAVALAHDLLRLAMLRASLRSRFEQSSLFDERRFASHFEELLRAAWRQSA